MKQILRRLRGALGTALAWGVAWFGAGAVITTAIYGLGLGRGGTQWARFPAELFTNAAELAAIGFLTGGAFSVFVATAFRNRRLEDLSPVKFALGGAMVSLLLAVGMIGAVTGFELIALQDLVGPLLTAGTLGGVTSWASIRFAKAALGPGDGPNPKLEAGPG